MLWSSMLALALLYITVAELQTTPNILTGGLNRGILVHDHHQPPFKSAQKGFMTPRILALDLHLDRFQRP